LVDGELQSRSWKTDEGHNRSIVEIKARRIQFLNKRGIKTETVTEDVAYNNSGNGEGVSETSTTPENNVKEDASDKVKEDSFDKFLSSEESDLIK
jgi:single-strand DNA-binding protein